VGSPVLVPKFPEPAGTGSRITGAGTGAMHYAMSGLPSGINIIIN